MLDYQFIVELLKSTEKIAMNHFLHVTASQKQDKTLVTEADRAIQEYLIEQLNNHFPSAGIIAEENHLRKAPTDCDIYFVIDPIDGTASFIRGLPVWGIAIGVVEGLRPVAGYFYMPVTGDMFYTNNGCVYRNDMKIKPIIPKAIQRESLLLTTSRFHKTFQIDKSYPGKVRCFGSTVAHIIYAATDSADAALVTNVFLWDVAMGLAMARLNGAVAQYLNGDTFVINEALLEGHIIDTPFLVGQRTAVEEYCKLIRFR